MKTNISAARTAAYKIIFDVTENKAFSNISVNNNLNLNIKNPLDRALAVNITYGTLKKYNRLNKILKELSAKPLGKLDKSTRTILMMSLYQLLYLTKVPEYAVVNDAVNMARFYAGSSSAGFTNAILRNALRQKPTLIQKEADFYEYMYYEYGFPDWVTKIYLKAMSREDLLLTAQTFEKAPDVTIRVNTLKTTEDKLIESLDKQNITAQKTYVPGSLIITNGASLNIFTTPSFKNGEFYASDLSGIIQGYVLNPKKTDKIIDICAAPGAKSFNAAIISGGAQIMSTDLSSNKLRLLSETALQLGLTNIKTAKRDSAMPPYENEIASFDALIADVPCSGLGVIRRKPEILYNLTEKHIAELTHLQYALLNNNLKKLKPGGTAVYSTCTLNPDENELMLQRVLSANPNIRLEPISLNFELKAPHGETKDGLLKLLPFADETDGFFIAKLKKVN